MNGLDKWTFNVALESKQGCKAVPSHNLLQNSVMKHSALRTIISGFSRRKQHEAAVPRRSTSIAGAYWTATNKALEIDEKANAEPCFGIHP